MEPWPATSEELEEVQRELAALAPPPWRPPEDHWSAAGCFVCFVRGTRGPGSAGDRGWAAAALVRGDEVVVGPVIRQLAGYAYIPGLLALRQGPLLEAAVRALPGRPDVLLVDATGRDHPRRAGLALHLGARLDLPSVGVTHRPLLADGPPPADDDGATTPLCIGDEVVASWVRPRRGLRPLVAHAAWRTSAEVAAAVVLALGRGRRTPEPLRAARRAARAARAHDER
ncbi:MAG: endonuclease V [Armatimonadota bacterium]|nr:endonuclease V [Armatimonadota bacterium]MDR7450589.1 endonuclease V [Armatimonadota bacterium]MDR7466278.1 endonuclease V [Armatimonadota bacterium]MDR7492999.1 endonuclease V [Armatimonadota bacterium]MDR7498244.1 endonuclease V [Armatimonadota bacterium]